MNEKREESWNPNEIIRRLLQKELSSISGLFHEYRGRLLVDDSLSNIDVFLLSYHFVAEHIKTSEVNQKLVKDFFIAMGREVDAFRKVMYECVKIRGYLDKKNDVLTIRVKGVKRLEEILGKQYKAGVILIKSGEQFSAIKRFEEFIREESKNEEILICDSYVSSNTLLPLIVLKDRIKSIKILTSNITEDRDKFKEYIKKFREEANINIEVRLNRKIHDRYLISGDKCWSIGSSIKDLGNKDTIIKEISEVTDSLKQLFMERWNESEIVT